MKPTFSIGLAATFMVLAAPAALAQCPNGGCPNQKPMVGTFRGGSSKMPTVTSIKDGVMVAGSKTYLVHSDARVILNGKPATPADLKVGMRVTVSGTRVPSATKGETVFRATRVTARQ